MLTSYTRPDFSNGMCMTAVNIPLTPRVIERLAEGIRGQSLLDPSFIRVSIHRRFDRVIDRHLYGLKQ